MSKVRFVDSNITISPGAGSGGGSSISSSYALSSSHADFATSASYAEYAVSASHEIVKEVSSSYADFALSSSHAITASYALNAGSSGIFKQTGSYYATTNDLQITGSIITTDSLTNKGYVYISGGTTLQAGTVAALYLGTSNSGMDIARYNDSSLVLDGITQQYGWRLFGIKHGLNSNTYTTEIDNLIATGSMRVSGSMDIALKSGSAFTITEDDVDQENRLTFEYENGDPTLIIAGRSAESSLHLKYNLAGEGLKITNQGLITKQVSGVEYGLRLSINSFQPETGNQLDLGYYNDRWKTLYLYTGNKISWGTTTNSDLASIRHTAGTSKLTITGSSDVTLDVKGDIISTGSLLVSGSVDIAIPSGSAFTITETDKSDPNDSRLDFFFDNGDPTLEIEGRSSVAKFVLSSNDGDTNNLKIQSDGQIFASDSVGSYTGSMQFLPNGIEAISVNGLTFVGSQTRPFNKYYTSVNGGQFVCETAYSLTQIIPNSSGTGTQRIDGFYNGSSGIRFIVSGSAVSAGDGYLRNPNNVYFQIQDNSTGTGNDASIPFRVGKSGSLAINLNQSKGFGFTQYYTASAMVHVEAEPNFDLNLFQGNDVSGNNVFEVDRDGNLTVDAEISASGDLRVRDGRFSRDGGTAEIEIIASEIAGGIIGTQTSDDLILRRFNIPKFTTKETINISHQSLEVQGNISASGFISASRFTVSSSADTTPGYTFWNNSTTGMLSNSPTNLKFQVDGTSSPELELNTGQAIFRTPVSFTDNEISGVSKIRNLGSISASGDFSSSITSTSSFGTYLGDGSQLTGIEAPSGKFGIANASGSYTYYSDLSSSLQAATAGDTIQLFTTVTESSDHSYHLKSGVNFNFNGNELFYETSTASGLEVFTDNGAQVTCSFYNGRVRFNQPGAGTNNLIKMTGAGTQINSVGFEWEVMDGTSYAIYLEASNSALDGGKFIANSGYANYFIRQYYTEIRNVEIVTYGATATFSYGFNDTTNNFPRVKNSTIYGYFDNVENKPLFYQNSTGLHLEGNNIYLRGKSTGTKSYVTNNGAEFIGNIINTKNANGITCASSIGNTIFVETGDFGLTVSSEVVGGSIDILSGQALITANEVTSGVRVTGLSIRCKDYLGPIVQLGTNTSLMGCDLFDDYGSSDTQIVEVKTGCTGVEIANCTFDFMNAAGRVGNIGITAVDDGTVVKFANNTIMGGTLFNPTKVTQGVLNTPDPQGNMSMTF